MYRLNTRAGVLPRSASSHFYLDQLGFSLLDPFNFGGVLECSEETSFSDGGRWKYEYY